MGRGRKEPQEERVELSNVGALHDRITSTFKGIFELDQQIAGRIERDIKPLRQSRSESIKLLKDDSGIPAAEIAAMYRVYAIQESAKLADDAAARDKVLDDMRTLFNALADGEMLDFVDVLDADAEEHIPAFMAKAHADKEASAAEEDAELAAAER